MTIDDKYLFSHINAISMLQVLGSRVVVGAWLDPMTTLHLLVLQQSPEERSGFPDIAASDFPELLLAVKCEAECR
jgi:hypothetical protein